MPVRGGGRRAKDQNQQVRLRMPRCPVSAGSKGQAVGAISPIPRVMVTVKDTGQSGSQDPMKWQILPWSHQPPECRGSPYPLVGCLGPRGPGPCHPLLLSWGWHARPKSPAGLCAVFTAHLSRSSPPPPPPPSPAVPKPARPLCQPQTLKPAQPFLVGSIQRRGRKEWTWSQTDAGLKPDSAIFYV